LFDGASAEISGTQMLGNASGGVAAYTGSATTTTAIVSDSVISGVTGTGAGVFAHTDFDGAVVRIFVTRCTIESTQFALDSETTGVGSAIVAVSYSMITNNTFGWYVSGAGAVLRTLGNNHITDNAGSLGALTPAALQ
jgi:hypothetical protein